MASGAGLPKRLPLLITVTLSEFSGPAERMRTRASAFSPSTALEVYAFAHRVRGWFAASAGNPVPAEQEPRARSGTPEDRGFRAPAGEREFYAQVRACQDGGEVRAGVDCHLLPSGFRGGPGNEAGVKLWLSNGGDVYGENRPGAEPATCPAETLRNLRDVAAARLADLPGDIGLNRPLKTGRLIRALARPGRPWLRVDLPVRLLAPAGRLDGRRLRDLHARLETILVIWSRIEGWI